MKDLDKAKDNLAKREKQHEALANEVRETRRQLANTQDKMGDRLAAGEDLDSVLSGLARLREREEALTKALASSQKSINEARAGVHEMELRQVRLDLEDVEKREHEIYKKLAPIVKSMAPYANDLYKLRDEVSMKVAPVNSGQNWLIGHSETMRLQGMAGGLLAFVEGYDERLKYFGIKK